MRSLPGAFRAVLLASLIGVGVVLSGVAEAQPTPSVTATCKDGSSFAGKSKRGACAHHGGVQAYTATGGAVSGPTVSATQATASTVPAKKPKVARTPSPKTPASTATVSQTAAPSAPAATPKAAQTARTQSSNVAASAVPGDVWVNTASKVYHCPGTRFHGKTNQGEYMSEAAAKAKGFRPSRGKECT